MSEHTPPPTVDALMTSIEKFLQIPYWFTVRQALAMTLQIRLEANGLWYDTGSVLVFDQEYQLIGELVPGDVIRQLALKLPASLRQHQPDDDAGQWASLIAHGSELLDDLQVAEVMTIISPDLTLTRGDSVLKAFYLLAESDRSVIPVIEDGQLQGVLRRTDVLSQIIDI